jgi:excisionase family DNA binding protein
MKPTILLDLPTDPDPEDWTDLLRDAAAELSVAPGELGRLARIGAAVKQARQPAPTNEPGIWLTAREAARYLGLGLRAFYSAVERRQIPASRLGRRLRFHRNGLDALLRRPFKLRTGYITEDKFLGFEEAERFIRAAPADWLSFLVIGIKTGLRLIGARCRQMLSLPSSRGGVLFLLFAAVRLLSVASTVQTRARSCPRLSWLTAMPTSHRVVVTGNTHLARP